MKLLVLCVDGLDPDLAEEYGYPKMPHERRMTVPSELCQNGRPRTLKVWPAMFSEEYVPDDEVLDAFFSKPFSDDILFKLNKYVRRVLVSLGAKKVLQALGIDYRRASKETFGWEVTGTTWRIVPFNAGIRTIADDYDSVMWNVPTLCPEFVFQMPFEEGAAHRLREYVNWKILTEGMSLYPIDLGIAYCHIVDFYAHIRRPVEELYLDVHEHAHRLSKRCDVMIVSDHGTIPETTVHTDHAYLGCTREVFAESVLDVKKDISRIMEELK